MTQPTTPDDTAAHAGAPEAAALAAGPGTEPEPGPAASRPAADRSAAAGPAPEDEERPPQRVRLRDRIVNRFEGQIQLPGGLVLNGVGKLGLVFLLLFLAVAGTVLVTRWEPTAKVPALVGVSREEAERRLAAAHLAVGGIEFEESDEPPGTVLRTDPRIGTRAAHDSGVTLVLARPFGVVVVPPAVVPSSVPVSVPPAAPDDTIVVVPGPPGAPGPPGVRGAPEKPAVPNPGRTAEPPVPTGTPGTVPVPTVSLGAVEAGLDPALDGCDTGYRVFFRQTVSMPGPGRLTYRWLRSDGAESAVQTADASPKGSMTIETAWTLGPGTDLVGWQQLDVIAPVAVRGARIPFERFCQGGEGAG
ncbi:MULTISPECIES: Stk1 family PASTA domain-containing Ser/Thr kinase [Catenuloplanes]|uniref:PASTA domain-containing protein n=1 Tax=Catenuloplanes niger TaxID=587534 RepID=A0AAE4CYC5_9ACTN|nr:PASTA domain-containing protein [Catenuloplanes niger]MDR7325694.1 hypothetical protein [Catenuloplanes niger]